MKLTGKERQIAKEAEKFPMKVVTFSLLPFWQWHQYHLHYHKACILYILFVCVKNIIGP